MKFRVKIFNEQNEIISDDIWYGNSVDNCKFWVDLAIKDIIKKLDYKHLSYEIDEADLEMSEEDLKRQKEIEEETNRLKLQQKPEKTKSGVMDKLFSMFGRK